MISLEKKSLDVTQNLWRRPVELKTFDNHHFPLLQMIHTNRHIQRYREEQWKNRNEPNHYQVIWAQKGRGRGRVRRGGGGFRMTETRKWDEGTSGQDSRTMETLIVEVLPNVKGTEPYRTLCPLRLSQQVAFSNRNPSSGFSSLSLIMTEWYFESPGHNQTSQDAKCNSLVTHSVLYVRKCRRNTGESCLSQITVVDSKIIDSADILTGKLKEEQDISHQLFRSGLDV